MRWDGTYLRVYAYQSYVFLEHSDMKGICCSWPQFLRNNLCPAKAVAMRHSSARYIE
jgi:hypothetical protein